ncbi:MAG: sugar transferase [Limisphaerales bacterium]
MIRLRHKLFIQALRVLDQVILIVALALIVGLYIEKADPNRIMVIFVRSYQASDGLGLALLVASWTWIFASLIQYDSNRFSGLFTQGNAILKASSLAAFLLLVVAEVFDIGRISKPVVVMFWMLSTILLLLSRLAIRGFLTAWRRSGRNYRFLLIIGADTNARRLVRRLERRPELGYKLVGLLDVNPSPAAPGQYPDTDPPVIGTLADLKPILEKGPVDEVMIALPLVEQFAQIYEVLRLARDLGVVVRVLPDAQDVRVLSRSQVELFEGDYVVTFFRQNFVWQLLGKRLLDIFVSSLMLILLSPLLLLVAFLVKVTSAGPVLFVQERVGMNKRIFRLYKFRSMVIDAEALKAALAQKNEMDGPVFKIRNDPRITRIGRFIRKTSIDELPQLLNVLKGDMSLVGPRPPLPSEVDKYEWLSRRRLSMRPGITCIWQISGRNEISFEQWMKLDRQYVDNWSFWLDLQILAKTVPVVLLCKGAS